MDSEMSAPRGSVFGIAALGIREASLSPAAAVRIERLDRFGACAKAGVATGDELITLEGEKLRPEDAGEHAEAICARAGIGSTVRLRIRRGAEELDLAVPLVERKRLDLKIQELNAVLERKIAP